MLKIISFGPKWLSTLKILSAAVQKVLNRNMVLVTVKRDEFDVFVMLCRIPCYFNCHVACSNLAFIWSPVVCSKHPFWAMCCPVSMHCDRYISCIVVVTYHVSISVQLVSYVVSIQCKLISLWLTLRKSTSKKSP